MYNGYVKSTHLYRRIANLIEQIPQSVRLSIAQNCIPDNGDVHDWERKLTGVCLFKAWEQDEQRQAEDADWLDLRATEEANRL